MLENSCDLFVFINYTIDNIMKLKQVNLEARYLCVVNRQILVNFFLPRVSVDMYNVHSSNLPFLKSTFFPVVPQINYFINFR